MLTLVIPAPDKALTSNQRLHHHVRAERTRSWRLRTALQARSFKPLPYAHITYWVHATSNRRRDVANFYPTVKACLDGVIDAGVLPDDDDKHVVGPDPRPGEKRAELTLTIRLDPDCTCHECAVRFADHQETA